MISIELKTVQHYNIWNKLLLETFIAYLFLKQERYWSDIQIHFLLNQYCASSVQDFKNIFLHDFQLCQPLLPDVCSSHRPFKNIQIIPKPTFILEYLINEELLLQEIEVGRVFLQLTHNLVHLRSAHLVYHFFRQPWDWIVTNFSSISLAILNCLQFQLELFPPCSYYTGWGLGKESPKWALESCAGQQ